MDGLPWWAETMPEYKWVPFLGDVGITLDLTDDDDDWDKAESCCISEQAWAMRERLV